MARTGARARRAASQSRAARGRGRGARPIDHALHGRGRGARPIHHAPHGGEGAARGPSITRRTGARARRAADHHAPTGARARRAADQSRAARGEGAAPPPRGPVNHPVCPKGGVWLTTSRDGVLRPYTVSPVPRLTGSRRRSSANLHAERMAFTIDRPTPASAATASSAIPSDNPASTRSSCS